MTVEGIRSTKHETRNNRPETQKRKCQKGNLRGWARVPFRHFFFGISVLFRVSCFGFRASRVSGPCFEFRASRAGAAAHAPRSRMPIVRVLLCLDPRSEDHQVVADGLQEHVALP